MILVRLTYHLIQSQNICHSLNHITTKLKYSQKRIPFMDSRLLKSRSVIMILHMWKRMFNSSNQEKIKIGRNMAILLCSIKRQDRSYLLAQIVTFLLIHRPVLFLCLCMLYCSINLSRQISQPIYRKCYLQNIQFRILSITKPFLSFGSIFQSWG